MRFMLLMKPGIRDDEWVPNEEAVAAMRRYNEELTQAGVLLALDGLRPPAEGVRIRVSGGEKVVTDGPFAESKEVVGGYWIIQAKSREEAIEWAKRCPIGEGPELELRPIMELSDLPEEVQAAAQLSQEPPEQTVER